MPEIRTLTEFTVNFVPEAVVALERAADLTGDTNTDTINRAVQAYASLLEAAIIGDGPAMLTFDPFDDGETVQVLVRPAKRRGARS